MSSTHKKSKTLFEESLHALRDKYITDTKTQITDPLLRLRQINTQNTLKLIDYENSTIQEIDKRFVDLKSRDTYLDDMKIELELLLEKVSKIELIVQEIEDFTNKD